MSLSSNLLRDYPGPNPFAEAQGRNLSRLKVETEFFPTSTFLSLINGQHEILLGTRGSGKTFLLRMLAYSHFRSITDSRLTKWQGNRSFIGFYVPLRLEFLSAQQLSDAPEMRIGYFQFACNCVAAMSLLKEISQLLEDLQQDPIKRLVMENSIAKFIAPYWLGLDHPKVTSIRDLRRHINLLYSTTVPWTDREDRSPSPLAAPLFTPFTAILPDITEELGLDPEETHWIACIDEAEFLREPFIKCINTFLRSEKRPLIVKMATLPTKHSTLATLVEGVSVQSNHDFNYKRIDMPWNSEEFGGFTDHICKVRLEQCKIQVKSLDEFLGSENDETGLDHYRREFGKEADDEIILHDILNCLSEARRARFDRIRQNKEHVRRQYLNRLRPVYYVRRMASEDRRGNRNVGWFAGGRTVRQIADGNPRRFIQIMNRLFESATHSELDEKEQHRILRGIAQSNAETVQGLPGHGTLLSELIAHIGNLLAARVHGQIMLDSGSGFYIGENLLEDELIVNALNLGIDYTQIIPSEVGNGPITSKTLLRLSYILSAQYWLPMREGERPTISMRDAVKQLNLFPQRLTVPLSRKFVEELQLTLDPDDEDETNV